uniref:Uncharacterized protein n=1 Tax=Panagrolaimus sp. ES5 TaxID=591445 RepID=A0AC34FR88_9BILA
MRVTIYIAVFAAVIGIISGAADPYAAAGKKIKTLISNFNTPAQIKTARYNGRQPEDMQADLITQGMNVLTNTQKAKCTAMYAKLSEELGGSAKAQTLLTTLMSEIGTFIKPFVDKVNTVMTAQKKAGKAKEACKKAALVQSNKFLTKANVQKAINNLKKKFSPAQCQIAFKHLAPTYIMLGKYNFLKPPCTGKGV